MEALLAVEREVDKALDSFGGFYEGVDEDLDKAIELVMENISNLAKCNFNHLLLIRNEYLSSFAKSIQVFISI